MATGFRLRQISLPQLNSPIPKTPAWCKNQEHISHRSPVIASFLFKFLIFSLPWQQGLVLRQISCTQLNSPTAKTPDWCKNQEHISHRSPVIANFLLKFSNFCYPGNRGWSETDFTYTVKFADPENPLMGARIRNISPIEAQL